MLTHMVRVELPLEETTKLFSRLAIQFCNLTSNVVLGAFFVYFWGFSTQSIMLSAKRQFYYNLYFSSFFKEFYFRNSSMMLNGNSKSGHPCLVPNLKKVFSL